MDCTIDSLIDCSKQFDDIEIITKDNDTPPIPVGADFTVSSLEQVVSLYDVFGSRCMADIVSNDDGSINIGYHFE